MKRFNSPALSALGAVVLTLWFTACGGLDDGAIVIVDSGGSASNGGTKSSGGSANDGEPRARAAAPVRTAARAESPDRDLEDPPVVVSVLPRMKSPASRPTARSRSSSPNRSIRTPSPPIPSWCAKGTGS